MIFIKDRSRDTEEKIVEVVRSYRDNLLEVRIENFRDEKDKQDQNSTPRFAHNYTFRGGLIAIDGITL